MLSSFNVTKASVIALSVLLVGACATIPVRPTMDEGEIVGEPKVKTNSSATQAEFANEGLLSSDLAYFDASKVRAYIGNSNITLATTTSTVVATLKNGSTAVASSSFPVYRSGNNIYFTSPATVTSWVRSQAGVANAFDLEMSPMAYNQTAGTNTFVVEVFYDADLVGGGAASRYVPPRQCQIGWCIEP